MKNLYLLAALLFAVTSSTIAQLPIAYYDFENTAHTAYLNQVKMQVNGGSSAFVNTGGDPIAADIGNGISYGGTINGYGMYVKNNGSSASTDPLTAATHYQQFQVSSSGFAVMEIEFDLYVNHNHSEEYGILYSTNNSTWNWVASVTTPGSNSLPNVVGAWNKAKIALPTAADNKANLYIRIYEYNSGNGGPNPYLIFDNVQVTAQFAVAGAGIKNMIDEYNLYANLRSGAVVNNCLKRNKFVVNGAGTTVNINACTFSGIAGGAGGNLTVSNNAVLNLNASTYNHIVEGAVGTVPVSAINVLTGGTINLGNTLESKGNLTLTQGTLNLNASLLKVSGAVSRSSGLINAMTGTVEYNATTGAQAVSGSFFSNKSIYKLVNSNAAGLNISSTANDTLRIIGSIGFGAVNNSVITTGNNLTLGSNASGTAALSDITNKGINSGNSLTGNVTVEKYIASGKKWHYLSFPINTTQTYRQAWQENNVPGANATPGYGMNIYSNINWAANGFDASAGGPTVKTFNIATATYTPLSSTLTAMNTLDAYMIYLRGDRSITPASPSPSATVLRVTGTLKQNTQAAISIPASKFVGISNPYAAALDMRKITKTAGVQDFFYVWDPNLGGSYGLGAFQLFSNNGTDYEVTPGGGSYGSMGSVNNFIKSGQAFFIRGAAGGTLTFTENAKADGIAVISSARGMFEPTLRANLFVVSPDTSLMADGIMAKYDGTYSNDVDENDALKFSNGSENLSLKRGNNFLTIESRNTITATDTLFLNLTGLRIQNYRWDLNLSNMEINGLTGFLVDSYLNTLTPLNMNGMTQLNFSVENVAGSYAASRFMVVFYKSVPLPVNITEIAANRINISNISVLFKTQNEMNIQQYEIERSANAADFTRIVSLDPKVNNAGIAAYVFNDNKALAGDNFYRVKAVSVNGRIQYSAIVKVAAVKAVTGINVYPNPVADHRMNLLFSNQTAGKYQLQLISQSGQVIMNSSISVSGNNSVKTVLLNEGITPGNYQLVIVSADADKTVQQVMIL